MRSFAEQADPEREQKDVAALDRVLAERARERAEMAVTHRVTPSRSGWLDDEVRKRNERPLARRKPKPRPAAPKSAPPTVAVEVPSSEPTARVVSPVEAAMALVRTPMRFDGSLASAGRLLIQYAGTHANGPDVLTALGAVAQATGSHGAVDVVHRVLREGRASTLRLIGEFHRAVEQVAPHIPFATFALLDAPLYRFVEHAYAGGVISWTIDREHPWLRR